MKKQAAYIRRQGRGAVRFLMVFFCFLFVMTGTLFAAERPDIGANITELSLNGTRWSYGEQPVSVSVTAGEDVHTGLVVYYTKHEWAALCEDTALDGTLTLVWQAPEGVSFRELGRSVRAVPDGEEITVGRLTASGTDFRITIDREYANLMAWNDNIELRMEAAIEFEKGSYDLGEAFQVTAGESGAASARWNNYTLTLSKIDEAASNRLLAGARFAIDVAENGVNPHDLPITQSTFAENGTFTVEGNEIVTRGDTKAVLVGGFEPGNIYCLEETRAPIGYLPSEESVQFAFYRYTDSEKAGTRARIRELNENYEEEYEEADGFVRVFGSKGGTAVGSGELFISNAKMPEIELEKKESKTKKALAGVSFTLWAEAAKADYTADQYEKIPGGGWRYDESTGRISWTMETDSEGILRFPAGTVPYMSGGSYTLTETVPDGYAASGEDRTLSFALTLTRAGTASIEPMGSGQAAASREDSMIRLTVLNGQAVNLKVSKVNQAGLPLAGAEFALYGPEDNGSEDVLTAAGKRWYYMDVRITDGDGFAWYYDLPYGTYYLVERKAPEGYAVLSSPYCVELKEEDVSEGAVTVTILNTVELVMPDMGAGGTGGRMAAGVFLIFMGTAACVHGKHESAKRES